MMKLNGHASEEARQYNQVGRRREKMAGEDVKVIGTWASPFAMRPRIALNIKGVNYEYLEENLEEKSELFLKSNTVYKKVPVLLHGERAICESAIIVEYIDRVWKNSSLLPADPYDHALAKFWAFYVDDKWFPSLLAILKTKTEEEKTAAIDQAQENTLLLEGAFEKCSKGGSFLGGNSIGYLDICLGSFLVGVKAMEKMFSIEIFSLDKTPHLSRWSESFCSEATVKRVMPETDKMLEYLSVLQAKWKNAPN